MIYDTNFLIAIQGRNKRFTREAAQTWIARYETGTLYLPRIVALEFASGMPSRAAAARHLMDYTILPMHEPVLLEAENIMRQLRKAGQGIGLADSMIAATARLYGLPLVTDNVRHFERIPGLAVRGFVE